MTVCCNDMFCKDISCHNCPILTNIGASACADYVNAHPHEAAELMGYEVIDDMLKNCKPIKDWTLEELKEYCENNTRVNCGDCPFIDNCNKIHSSAPTVDKAPHSWDLRQYWTKEEIELAQLLKRYSKDNNVTIKRYDDNCLSWHDKSIEYIYTLPKELFPSIKNGMEVRLTDIVNGE